MNNTYSKRTKDLTGETFGRWTVVSFAGIIRGHARWNCVCSCGTERIVQASRLMNGTTTSCGCWQKENARQLAIKHGMWRSTEYRIWAGLVNRCTNPKNPDFPHYGGRGITVCDKWRDSFTNFYSDMGPRPSPKHSVDRIDNNLGYCPENCRWATSKEQCRNARYNVPLTYGGKTQIITEWAKELGISLPVLRWRLRHWPIEKTMTQPIEVYKKKGR